MPLPLSVMNGINQSLISFRLKGAISLDLGPFVPAEILHQEKKSENTNKGS
jgi:hypothetical protein